MKTIFAVLLWATVVQEGLAQDKTFHWLIGKWKLEGKETYEVWALEGPERALSGQSFRLSNTDTIVTEVIKLEYFEGHYHYIPDIAGDQPPVDFRITSSDHHSFVAENPQHDFPKIIRYRLVRKNGNDFLEAAIEGDGKVISYSFKKIK